MRTKPFPHDYLMNLLILPLIPRFVTPNAVTCLRFLLTPLVLYFIFINDYSVAIPLFIFTAFTDVIDGSLARMRQQVTKWGTIYDPVADKILIIGATLILIFTYLHPAIGGMIIGMEVIFLLGGYNRMKNAEVQSPSWFGKIKMLCQVIGVTCLLIFTATAQMLLIYLSTIAFMIAIILALLNIIKYGIQISG